MKSNPIQKSERQPPRINNQIFPKKNNRGILDLVCFRCKNKGHYANNCPDIVKNERINTINDGSIDIDVREILLNEFSASALFDSGASSNFIGAEILSEIGADMATTKRSNWCFRLADNSECWLKRSINSNVEYDKRNEDLEFIIVDNNPRASIIGFKSMKILRKSVMMIKKEQLNQAKKFPIVCKISTNTNKVISWSRR